MLDVEDGFCPNREDGLHCEHWWDGEKCCSCEAPAMTREQMIEQGMIEDEEESYE